MPKGQRDSIKQCHGRSMKSSNTNHLVLGQSAGVRKPTKAHQVATQRATTKNKLIVNRANLRSAIQNQAAVRALM